MPFIFSGQDINGIGFGCGFRAYFWVWVLWYLHLVLRHLCCKLSLGKGCSIETFFSEPLVNLRKTCVA